VLSVSYRGSTGFGKAFVNTANLEWAGKMHDDLIDAVDWSIAHLLCRRHPVVMQTTHLPAREHVAN
jgi:dipeptidyl aminopeptidase/acylaminoacyl peptidase